MNLAHSLTCCLHGGQGLPVDVGRLNRIYLLLEGGDLTQRGLEGAFGDLFASQGLLRSYLRQSHTLAFLSAKGHAESQSGLASYQSCSC